MVTHSNLKIASQERVQPYSIWKSQPMINKSRLAECIITWWNQLRPSLRVQSSRNPFRFHSTLLEAQHWPTTSWCKEKIKKTIHWPDQSLTASQELPYDDRLAHPPHPDHQLRTHPHLKKDCYLNKSLSPKGPTWTRSPSSSFPPPPAPDRHHPTTSSLHPSSQPPDPPHPSGAPLEGETLKNQRNLKRNKHTYFWHNETEQVWCINWGAPKKLVQLNF